MRSASHLGEISRKSGFNHFGRGYDAATIETPDSTMGVDHVYSTDSCTAATAPGCVVPQQDRPVGWYRDADEPSGHRYWDGESWQTATL